MSVGRVRPFGRPFVPVPTGAESADFDRWAIQSLGVPQSTLMENAGRGAARVLHRLFPAGEVVAFVGAGNNGGDALVMLRSLREWGRDVRAVLVADRPEDEPLLHGWPVERVSDSELGEQGVRLALARAAVVVDGVLGTGARGAPRARQAAAISAINASGRPVVALDVPSGVDANDGSVPGDAVRADVTVAFGWPKLGALLHPGRAYVGRLVALDIGFPPADEARFAARLITPGWASTLHPARALDTHKKAVGVLLIVAGSPGMAGAAVLAAGAAMRVGAGLVRVASSPENRVVLQTAAPGAVFVNADDEADLAEAVADSTALAIGPGLGRSAAARSLLTSVLRMRSGARDPGSESGAPVLLDADALNLVAEGAVSVDDLAGQRRVLLTPHQGEMSRLAPEARDEFRGRRVEAARDWADRHGCTLLLKGSPSIVAAPGAPLLVDSVGSSDLATAGMGDVLTGVAGAFLAQGLPPHLAGALALHVSGRAARIAGKGRALLPEDVIDHLANALAERGDGDTDLERAGLLLDQDAAS